jgi:hypothetical protein
MRDKTATAVKNAVQLALAYCSAFVFITPSAASAQLSDPMAPPGVDTFGAAGATPGTHGNSELQAVISGPGRRLAIINGNVVQVGQAIPGDGELLSVNPDSAIVRSGDKNIRLRLHPDSAKKKSAP